MRITFLLQKSCLWCHTELLLIFSAANIVIYNSDSKFNEIIEGIYHFFPHFFEHWDFLGWLKFKFQGKKNLTGQIISSKTLSKILLYHCHDAFNFRYYQQELQRINWRHYRVTRNFLELGKYFAASILNKITKNNNVSSNRVN